MWIIAALLHGSGLRLSECLELRVKDVDFDRNQLLVRRGKGQKDRATLRFTAKGRCRPFAQVVSDVVTRECEVGVWTGWRAAKPIIDISVVVPSVAEMPVAINRLAVLGYVHQGNLGVEGREAFRAPGSMPRHHLYLCPSDSLALRNHLAVRDHLRAYPEIAKQYGELKKWLAGQHPEDIDTYTEGTTEAIIQILEAAGFRSDDLSTIERINRRTV